MVAGLAAAAGVRSAADAGRLVARAARVDAAVQGRIHIALPVDVFQEVKLADTRPVGEDAAEGRAKRPESRPVTLRRRARHVRLLDGGFDRHPAARRRLEVGTLCLDAARAPVA